jgi:hypothetical protein
MRLFRVSGKAKAGRNTRLVTSQCEFPQWVESGHMHRSKKALFDHVVGASEQQGRQL